MAVFRRRRGLVAALVLGGAGGDAWLAARASNCGVPCTGMTAAAVGAAAARCPSSAGTSAWMLAATSADAAWNPNAAGGCSLGVKSCPSPCDVELSGTAAASASVAACCPAAGPSARSGSGCFRGRPRLRFGGGGWLLGCSVTTGCLRGLPRFLGLQCGMCDVRVNTASTCAGAWSARLVAVWRPFKPGRSWHLRKGPLHTHQVQRRPRPLATCGTVSCSALWQKPFRWQNLPSTCPKRLMEPDLLTLVAEQLGRQEELLARGLAAAPYAAVRSGRRAMAQLHAGPKPGARRHAWMHCIPLCQLNPQQASHTATLKLPSFSVLGKRATAFD